MISQLGDSFRGEVFTWNDYKRAEDGYVASVRLLLEAGRVDSLSVQDLSFNRPGHEVAYRDLRPTSELGPVEGQSVVGPMIDDFVRHNLRETFWCRLVHADRFFIHFGWDYYMYVGLETSSEIDDLVPPPGIFFELYESPYHPE